MAVGHCGSGDDCNDANPDIHRGALEGPPGSMTCADGRDNDCDGLTDKDDEFCGGSWFPAQEAEASEAGFRSGARARVSNVMALLFLPIGTIVLLKTVRRKK